MVDQQELIRIHMRAIDVVRKSLGKDWLSRLKDESEDERLCLFRLVHLAHSCKLFEGAKGFGEFTRKLKERGVLQAVSELFGATFFHQAGFEVEFNHGSRKGDDFDLLAKSRFFDISIETKTAGFEGTARLDYLRTIANCVKKASTQLPKQGVNAIFLLVPQDLLSSEELGWAIRDCIFCDALRQTTRIHTVAFGCEMFDETRPRYGLSNTAFPHPESSNVRRGCQIAHLLRRVPAINVGGNLGSMPQLDLEVEMQKMPKFEVV